MIQRLRFCAANTEGMGSIPSWGTKIPHAIWCDIKIKKKKGTARTE